MGIQARRIVITGASRGLGATLCQMLSARGADVWMMSRSENDMKSVADECHGPGHLRWSICDVAVAEHVERAASQVASDWGSLDVLVNNAAVWLEGDLDASSPADISQLIAVNLTGPILMTRAFWRLLTMGSAPHIVNVGSLAAIEPGPDWPVYAASKYGLRGFSESIGQVLEKEGIRVSLVNPGGIDTQLYVSAGYDKKVHQPWMMEPEVLADAIISILDKEADGRVSQIDIRKFGS